MERAGGYEFVGWCEIDKFAQQAYLALYDTGGIDTGGLTDFDLLVGGFPCQPFSVAGKRLGTADRRGDLFFELARLLKDKRPRYFVFENVPGLLGIEKGQTFCEILTTLSELGYCVEWLVHDSAGFGVPQSRKRVYLAGCLGENCSGKILAFGRENEENNRKVKQLIGGNQSNRVYDARGLAVTQCSGSGGGGGKTGLYFISAEDEPRAFMNPFKETVRCNGRRMKEPGESMFTLTVADRHGVIHKGRIRRLMPIECWRLQGFTDEQFQKVAATGMSDAQLYKQAGNAVTVNVVEAIGRNLRKFDEELIQNERDKGI